MNIQPPFPEFLPEAPAPVDWTFPDLSRAKRITIDCETKDPHLNEKGPGFIRGDAFIAGVAINADDEFIQYYPVRHLQGDNLPPNIVFEWLQDQLKHEQQKVGANLLYDFEALVYEGVTNIGGAWADVQVAEPLIDEETANGYSLEVLAKKYLGRGKEEDLLKRVASMYKKGFKGKKAIELHAKKDLWALPSHFVGPYAIHDVILPSAILDKQLSTMSTEDLLDIWKLESSLGPVLLEMRKKGVAVDIEAAELLAKDVRREIDVKSTEIKKLIGFDVNVDSSKDLKTAYERLSYAREELEIHLRYTAAGNPSFTAEWLEAQDDPLSELILRKRKLQKMLNNFILGDIIGDSVNGRIHSQFHQLRQDDSGTRSGRFSSTNPNLQQVPARDEEWAPKIRSLFVADQKKKLVKADYSQQEPRLLLHFAYLLNLPGSVEAVEQFRRNPKTDYHQMTTDIVNRHSIVQRKRKQIKGINLGVMYSMGKKKLSKMLGISMSETDEIMKEYNNNLQFVKKLSNKAMTVAAERGSIRTLLRRVRRFNLYEPVPTNDEGYGHHHPLPLDRATAAWPGRRLQRAGVHKALNALIQGSAADQTKEAMRVLYYDHGIVMHMQVHDELVGSVEDVEEARTIKRAMETCVKLALPVVADTAIGDSWGTANQEVTLTYDEGAQTWA